MPSTDLPTVKISTQRSNTHLHYSHTTYTCVWYDDMDPYTHILILFIAAFSDTCVCVKRTPSHLTLICFLIHSPLSPRVIFSCAVEAAVMCKHVVLGLSWFSHYTTMTTWGRHPHLKRTHALIDPIPYIVLHRSPNESHVLCYFF